MTRPAPTKETITIREDSPDPGDHEWIDVTRDGGGYILLLVWTEEAAELEPHRYQPVRWTRTTYRWRPRLRIWDREWRANDLYPGKPDHVTRDRVDSIPAELLAKLQGAGHG